MINGKWNTHINTSNIVFPNKKSIFYALEIYTESAHLNYPAPVIQSEIHSIFSVPPSTDERDTLNTIKEKLNALVTFPILIPSHNNKI